ncbi:hypothetical protein AtubIFM57258_005888 [Aspergillus tubingensis]|nr:hypothetical protein AtubIFM57258_005888 [Aspergillus tubingensis]
MRLGFLGLGVMGTPMAINLSKHYPLTAWNRSANKFHALKTASPTARFAPTPTAVALNSDIIFTMLFNAPAIDSILTTSFLSSLRDKVLINTSSIPVSYSQHLSTIVHSAGGKYIEMPVSGSKVPAEQGQLVGMIAGDPDVVETVVKPVVKPLTCAAVYCGREIGSGLKMKYAVNTLLITLTVGLAESMNLAKAQGLDLEAWGKVLAAGPMASRYSGVKVEKMLRGDWEAQAAIKDCFNSTELIRAAAREVGVECPLMDVCGGLYGRAVEGGLGGEDMSAVGKVIGKV